MSICKSLSMLVSQKASQPLPLESVSCNWSTSHSAIQAAFKKVSQLVSQSFNQSVGKSVSRPVSQSVSQSISQSINQSVNWSVSQSVRQTVSQSGSRLVPWLISKSINQSADKSINPWTDSFINRFNLSVIISRFLSGPSARLKNNLSFIRHSTEIVFEDFCHPFYLQQYGKLRFWYGEDLKKHNDTDNQGQVCFDVLSLFI